MKTSMLSVLAFTATMVSATAVPARKAQRDLTTIPTNATLDCIAPKLCCGTLTTPVDGLADGLLALLGINGAEVVGEVGLLCHPYDDTCKEEPSCCTEANVLSGVLALGCSKVDV
ncbi:hypothetical protein MPDQ_001660 [Monascus purpureus]|uniref:Hydrophobin n=1 Tax=Monascus purpureus TaxID=5098 RepID=A0A507QM41_MONPU|nr:hypothetical protein MPDQ_001660 [Monascus purpureus]BDD64393.1 hypothetical protein MAP00_009218 [Monascus purpureus]